MTKTKPTSTYEIILFDADETLFDFEASEREALKLAMMDYGFTYEEAEHLELYKEVNTAIWQEFERGEITQKVLKIERFRRFADRLGADFDPEAFAVCYMKHLGAASILYDESYSLIEHLSNHYKIGIITNGLTVVQENRVVKSKLAPFLQTVVISESVGVSKPDPRIFELALEELKHRDRKTVLMVGDSLSSDIQGGINANLDTCWYNPKRLQNSSPLSPTYEIHTLDELRNLL